MTAFCTLKLVKWAIYYAKTFDSVPFYILQVSNFRFLQKSTVEVKKRIALLNVKR